MHGSIRDQLENLLAAGEPATGQTKLGAHLAQCPECSSELKVMREQNSILRSMRAGEEFEPLPGFYARVLQRIEDRAKASIWAGFLYSPFRTRFAYASLSLHFCSACTYSSRKERTWIRTHRRLLSNNRTLRSRCSVIRPATGRRVGQPRFLRRVSPIAFAASTTGAYAGGR